MNDKVTASATKKRALALQILLFSLPLMGTSLLQVLFNMADVAIVGRYAGSMSMAAVGSTSIAVTLFTGILIGFGGGVNALVAKAFGAKDRESLRKTIHSAAIICLGVGVLMLLFGLFCSRPLLELLNTKSELIDKATLYMTIYFLGMPALAIFNFGNAVFSAIGNTKKPLIYMSVAGVLNVVLNLFFVIVCNLDVAGVAIASIISQYLSALLIIIALFRTKEDYGMCVRELRLDRFCAKSILGLGAPAGLQNAMFYVANLFVQAGVNSFDTVTVAGNVAAANADSIVFEAMGVFCVTCSSFVGRAYGAENKKEIKRSYFISLAYACGIGAALGLAVISMGPTFLSLFTDDGAVVEAGMTRLVIMGLSYGISPLMDVSVAASRGVGKSVMPTLFVILGSCVFRIAWIYTVFAFFGTVASLYLLYAFSWGITAVFEMIYFFYCYRKLLVNKTA